MGGKTTTSTSKVEIPQEVLARYNAVNTRAEDVAQKPFQIYSTNPADFVAQMNPQQMAGVSGINAAAGYAQPFVGAGAAATSAGMGPANLGELNVDQYMSPYLKNVVSSTADILNQQNQQAMAGQLGTAIRSGAFGGDRSGIAAANLAQQQRMADASILSGLMQQGYSQAQGVAQQQQGAQLSAEQANLARLLGGGQQLASLGVAGQQAALQGAGAQLEAGTLGQQTEQAGLTAMYNQFMQQQAYPFQVAQFLANIAMGTGALSGSTTTTTQPTSFWSDRRLKEGIKRIGKTDDGMPIYKYRYKGDQSGQTHIGFMADEVEKRHPEAVGLAAGYKTVDYDRATRATGGGVMGPYAAGVGSSPYMESYVPQAYLPVGEMMIADPVELDRANQGFLAQMEAAANFGRNIKSLRENYNDLRGMGREIFGAKAYGGGVKGPMDRDDGPGSPATTETPLTGVLASQDKQEKPALQPAGAPQGGGGGDGGLGGLLAGAGGFASGMAKLLPVLAGFSDRRLKEGIRRVGQADNGLPIYTYRFKGDDSGRTHMGFMADEVEKRHPEAVGLAAGYKTVDYDRAARASGGVVGREGYEIGGAPTGRRLYMPSPAIADELYQEGVVSPRIVDLPAERAAAEPAASGVALPSPEYGNYGARLTEAMLGSPEAMAERYPAFSEAPAPGLRPRRNPLAEAEAASIARDAMGAIAPRTVEVIDAPISPAQPLPSAGLVPSTAEVAPSGGQGGRGLVGALSGALSNQKPYEERNALGKMMYDPKTNKLSDNAILSILSGIGTMASSPSLYLGSSILQGLGGFANTMAGLREQEANMEQTRANTEQTKLTTDIKRFFTVGADGMPMFQPVGGGPAVPLAEYLENPRAYTTGNPVVDQQIYREAVARSQTAGAQPAGQTGAPSGNPIIDEYVAREKAKLGQGKYGDLVTASREISNEISSAADAAITSRPEIRKQLEAISNMSSPDSDIQSGALAEFQGRALGYVNSILALAGEPPLSQGLSDQQILDKMSIVNSFSRARGAGQMSLGAAELAALTSPGKSLEPAANASLMAGILMENRHAIELENFMRQYAQMTGGFVTEAPVAFSRMKAQSYIEDRPLIENIIKAGRPVPGSPSAIDLIMSPNLTRDQKISLVVGQNAIDGIEVSPEKAASILSYFGV